MELLLEHTYYNLKNWNVCADLKLVTLLPVMQLGYTR